MYENTQKTHKHIRLLSHWPTVEPSLKLGLSNLPHGKFRRKLIANEEQEVSHCLSSRHSSWEPPPSVKS